MPVARSYCAAGPMEVLLCTNKPLKAALVMLLIMHISRFGLKSYQKSTHSTVNFISAKSYDSNNICLQLNAGYIISKEA